MRCNADPVNVMVNAEFINYCNVDVSLLNIIWRKKQSITVRVCFMWVKKIAFAYNYNYNIKTSEKYLAKILLVHYFFRIYYKQFFFVINSFFLHAKFIIQQLWNIILFKGLKQIRSGAEYFKDVSYFLLFHPSVSSLYVLRSLIRSVHNYGAPRVTSGITSLLTKRKRAAI